MTTQEILGAIALSAAKNDVVAVNVKYAEDIFNVVYAAVDESEADDVNDWTDDGARFLHMAQKSLQTGERTDHDKAIELTCPNHPNPIPLKPPLANS